MRVVFDVSDRLPDVAAGVAALVVSIAIVIAWLRHSPWLESHWRLVLGAGAILIAVQGVADRGPVILGFGVIGAVFGRLAAAQASAPIADPQRNSALARLFLRLFIFVGAILFGITRIDAVGLRQDLAAGRATVIEGEVDVYLAIPWKTECISVSAHRFCYSDNNVTTGFNHTHSLGGPMVSGLHVRLYVIRDQIVRVEAANAP